MDLSEIGGRIKAAREQMNLTQEELAAMVDLRLLLDKLQRLHKDFFR